MNKEPNTFKTFLELLVFQREIDGTFVKKQANFSMCSYLLGFLLVVETL